MTTDLHDALSALAEEVPIRPGNLSAWQHRARSRVRRRRASLVAIAVAIVGVGSSGGAAWVVAHRADPAHGLYAAGGSSAIRIGPQVTLAEAPPGYDLRQSRPVPAGPAPLGAGTYVALFGDDGRGINITVRHVTADPLPADLSTLGLDVQRQTVRGHPGVSYRLSHDLPATGKLLRRDHVVSWLERPGLWIQVDVATSSTDTGWGTPLAKVLQSLVTT